ncbi:hypothetical protein AC1031_002563 [Aphanomyces cochlioides]|nr:hypothetical protein AC1031_002563 [Aphanomyces cochlioides]
MNKKWKEVIKQYPVVEFIALRSRGRFARKFIEQVLTIFKEDVKLWQLLDDAFAAVNMRMQRGKLFLGSKDGINAQFVAVSYTHTKKSASNSNGGPPLKQPRLVCPLCINISQIWLKKA